MPRQGGVSLGMSRASVRPGEQAGASRTRGAGRRQLASFWWATASPSPLGPRTVPGGLGWEGQSRFANGAVMMALARTIQGTPASV